MWSHPGSVELGAHHRARWLPRGRPVLLQGFSPLCKDESGTFKLFLLKVFLRLQATLEIKCKKENLTM